MPIVLDGTAGITTPDLTDTSLTTGRVVYTTTSGNLTSSANLLYSGTDMTVYGLTVGRGAGAVSTNTAVGAAALNNGSLSGGENVGLGYNSAQGLTTGVRNTILGSQSGQNLTTGSDNILIGYRTVYNATSTGSNNVAVGSQSLYSNTTGSSNTAVGHQAGYTNTTGGANTFFGWQAGYTSNTTNGSNVFVGYRAGKDITTGESNVVLGGFQGNQDSLNILTASNYVVIADGDGNRQITMKEGQTLALDSAVPNAGTGITFPATQSASSNANTLDDYEEGTWTPTVLGSSTPGTGTYTHQIGNYVKVGQMVCASALITITAHTGTGNLLFGGLPFNTSNSNGLNRFGVAIGGLNNLALSATNVAMIKAANNDTILYATQYPIGGGAETDVPIDTNFQIVFTITYRST